MISQLFAAIAALLALGASAHAQSVSVVPTEGAVTGIVQTPRGTYAETERGTFRISEGECPGDICLTPDVIRGLPKPAPEGALPDGKIAEAANGDIRRAWYGRPTDRYAHCVLGDCLEGASLVAETADGKTVEFILPAMHVFEDIAPRLFDFYQDGTNEIVTIRSSRKGGAAVVIYGLRDGMLTEIAASSENGRANRWLNIAAIVPRDYLTPSLMAAKPPFNEYQVLFVRTPHINGRLSRLSLEGGKVTEENDIRNGVSNHVIGSRELDLFAHLPTKDGGEGFLPSQSRDALVALTGRMNDLPLPGKIDKAIVALDNHLVTATEDGRLLSIKP